MRFGTRGTPDPYGNMLESSFGHVTVSLFLIQKWPIFGQHITNLKPLVYNQCKQNITAASSTKCLRYFTLYFTFKSPIPVKKLISILTRINGFLELKNNSFCSQKTSST